MLMTGSDSLRAKHGVVVGGGLAGITAALQLAGAGMRVTLLESRPRLERSGPYLYLHWGEGEQWWLGLEREPAGTHASIPAS